MDGVSVFRTPDTVMVAQLAAWDVVANRIAEDDPFFAKVMESQKACARNIMGYLNLNQPDYPQAFNHYFGRSGHETMGPGALPVARSLSR